MNIQYIQRGQHAGKIDFPRSIQTMDRGEIWHINPRLANMQTIRNACSQANRKTDMLFSASCPGYSEPCITITRIR